MFQLIIFYIVALIVKKVEEDIKNLNWAGRCKECRSWLNTRSISPTDTIIDIYGTVYQIRESRCLNCGHTRCVGVEDTNTVWAGPGKPDIQ